MRRTRGERAGPEAPCAVQEGGSVTELDYEPRMLIDGKLVGSDSGQTFDNVNPATEEVIGPVFDASAAEMHRAIDAAAVPSTRRAGRRTASCASGA